MKITHSIMMTAHLDDGRAINININKEGITLSCKSKKVNSKLTMSILTWIRVGEQFEEWENQLIEKRKAKLQEQTEAQQ